MDVKLILVALLVACSGGKTKAVEDARRPPADAAPVVPPAVAHGYRVDTTVKTGDVQVRIEWKDVPQALRAPGPSTHCGVARAPAVTPTTTWGVPDVLVVVDVDHGKVFEPAQARIVLEECDFAPRAIVAGAQVTLASAMPEPVTVTLQPLAKPLGGPAITDAKPRTIYLPIIGHEALAALEPDTVYAISYGTDDVATVVSATTPYVAASDASGNVVLREVPIGTHPVRAYLAARNGGEARTATGTITVNAGALAELTLDISR